MSWQSQSDGGAALFDQSGQRKYLTRAERARFLSASDKSDPSTAALAHLLALTGCRISEALGLIPGRLDAGTCRVVFRTLKRRRLTFRAVPVPASLMAQLVVLADGKQPDEPLWNWCRQTAWRRVKRLMVEARVCGPQATPKGCRHGFGMANAEASIPPGITQVWMGHARLETTAIYQNAVGEEERTFATRLWADLE